MGIRLLPLLSLLLMVSVAPAKPGASRVETHTPPTEVRFVIFGDSQFANHDVFERMAHEVDMLRPHFVIQVGDLINGYTHDRATARAEWDTFRGQIAPLSMPFYPVPGNHDVVTPELQEVYGEIWGQDRYTYSFTWGNVHCIALNSFWADAESKDHDRIGQWQKDWLARDLAEYKELHGGDISGHSIFVFLHSPLWRYADTHPGRQDWNEIHAILQQYPVKLVIGGHTHEHVWEQQDGVDYLVLNSSGGKSQDNERGGFFHAYLHVSVVGDDVRYATLKAGSILPLDTVDSRDRRTFPRHSLRGEMLTVEGWVPGQPLDTQVTVPVHNPLKEARRYRLDWRIPFGADIAAEPGGTWIELAPDESRELTFRLTSPAAPSLDLRPSLEVSATDIIRTGIVDRATEAGIRAQREDAGADPAAFRTQVRLDEPTTFSARHTLFVPPVAKAAPLAGAITLDGVLDEEAWKAATPVDDFINASAEKGNRTTVRFLYDADHLYVGAWLGEPNPAGLKADANPATPMAFTWDDDDFELFFDAAVTGREYSRLFINNAGTRFNSRPRDWAEESRYFPSLYESAIHIGEDHWSIEMRIPWSDMNAPRPATAGDRWGIMIARHRQQQPEARIQWRGPTGTGMYDPRQYGVLVFE